MLNVQRKEILESYLVYANKFLRMSQSYLQTKTKDEVSAIFFFLLFETFMTEKQSWAHKVLSL